jgi:hypothetical protein
MPRAACDVIDCKERRLMESAAELPTEVWAVEYTNINKRIVQVVTNMEEAVDFATHTCTANPILRCSYAEFRTVGEDPAPAPAQRMRDLRERLWLHFGVLTAIAQLMLSRSARGRSSSSASATAIDGSGPARFRDRRRGQPRRAEMVCGAAALRFATGPAASPPDCCGNRRRRHHRHRPAQYHWRDC